MAANTGNGSTALRSFRAPDALWLPAVEKAQQPDQPTVTDVLLRALSDFTGVPVPTPPAPAEPQAAAPAARKRARS
jgi:hypothetical protein